MHDRPNGREEDGNVQECRRGIAAEVHDVRIVLAGQASEGGRVIRSAGYRAERGVQSGAVAICGYGTPPQTEKKSAKARPKQEEGPTHHPRKRRMRGANQ
jgi:hypothetical protein